MTGFNKKSQDLIASVPAEKWAELARLHSIVTTTRGWTPLESESRKAGDEFYDLVRDIHENYGLTLWLIAINLGLNGRTIKHWMYARGYVHQNSANGKIPPSLKQYQGVVVNQTPKDTCKRGHDLTNPDNVRIYTDTKTGRKVRHCVPCRRIRYHEAKNK